MKKYIVLSVNDNVDYLYFTPLTCWAWRKFGWEPIVMFKGGWDCETEKYSMAAADLALSNPNVIGSISKYVDHNNICLLRDIEGYRSDTITQISRLYASCVQENGYLMTGDIDMIPLSDYWKPDFNKPTVWGHDLTGFGHYPICYIGMLSGQWDDVMGLESITDYNKAIEHDLDTLPQAKNPDFYKYWFSDQDLITERLKQYGTGKIDFINRGQYPNGFAKGRVDRGAWTLEHDVFIDAHLEQQTHHSPDKIKRLYDLLEKVWPNEDFGWFRDYTNKFRELAR